MTRLAPSPVTQSWRQRSGSRPCQSSAWGPASMTSAWGSRTCWQRGCSVSTQSASTCSCCPVPTWTSTGNDTAATPPASPSRPAGCVTVERVSTPSRLGKESRSIRGCTLPHWPSLSSTREPCWSWRRTAGCCRKARRRGRTLAPPRPSSPAVPSGTTSQALRQAWTMPTVTCSAARSLTLTQTCSPHASPQSATARCPSVTVDIPPDTTFPPLPTPASEGRCGATSLPPRVSPSHLHWSPGLHFRARSPHSAPSSPRPPYRTIPHTTPAHPLGPVRGWKGATQWGAGSEGSPPSQRREEPGHAAATSPSLPPGTGLQHPAAPSEELTGRPTAAEVLLRPALEPRLV
ncbi:hypothetical protein ANANG_G00109420 [Anguilla anguilla]|uniref:Uncharacterized protein n=1 Tax=Anguilla anguilla TaxID=7936 RepID=A0A9D3RZV5_ANGAN|nr:hypothetical protein ANANG_G00109420 [Anguilla anguilla]